MKMKRCTNSSCRKMFKRSYSCPFCGKLYPRLMGNFITVLLINYNRDAKIKTIKVVRDTTGMGLRQAKDAIENCKSEPVVLYHGSDRNAAMAIAERCNSLGSKAVLR